MMSAAVQEVGPLRTARGEPKVFLKIPEPFIKIEWGPNISPLKDDPRGSSFKGEGRLSKQERGALVGLAGVAWQR